MDTEHTVSDNAQDEPRRSHSPPLLVSGPEARRLLGVGNTKFWQLVNSGALETVVVGRRRQIRYASILRLCAGGRG